MTQAILPMNLRALRVNSNDAQVLTSHFKGRVAQFEMMPHGSAATQASTGAAIVQPLESTATPIVSLKAGLHLHWELPDAYKRGVQGPEGGDPVFPHAPNLWLVLRYLQRYDPVAQSYGPVLTKGFVVESDYVSATLQTDSTGVVRPSVSVPLAPPAQPTQPYSYMGRVRDLETWTGPAAASNYLPAYAPNYLTSIGFVGPSFASYYPECNSVFGFWDHFQDLPDIATAITGNTAIQFRLSYQVVGWVREANDDLFAGFPAKVTTAYNAYVAEAARQNAAVTLTPADEMDRLAQHDFKLAFNTADIGFTLNPDKTVATLDAPETGLCAGVIQNLVWDMLDNPGSRYFLANPDGAQPNPVWTDNQIALAVGNTTIEALSALIAGEIAPSGADTGQKATVEMLLDALQLGVLHNLGSAGNSLIQMDETLHSRGFAKQFGGYVWTVTRTSAKTGEDEASLPLELAERLSVLNTAQKAYDQGRAELDTIRKQLFMDWLRFINLYIGQPNDAFTSQVAAFLDSQDDNCALGYVVSRGLAVGLASYAQDAESGAITGLNPPSGVAGSLAATAYAAWQDVVASVPDPANWQVQATPGPAFWEPTDPVLVMQGDRLEPVRRNWAQAVAPARLTAELLKQLTLSLGGKMVTLPVSDIAGLPVIGSAVPLAAVVQALVAEAALYVPMLAGNVAAAAAPLLAAAGVPVDSAALTTALNVAQGGQSPLDPPLPVVNETLYDRLHAVGALPLRNPTQAVTAPVDIVFGFTNATATGWTPYGPAIMAQESLPSFAPDRMDPYLPVFLLWETVLDPMARGQDSTYAPDCLSQLFELDADRVDFTYAPTTDITTGTPVTYRGSVVLSRQPTRTLTAQIDQYEKLYPQDAVDAELDEARAAYAGAQIMSQGIGGFGQEQVLQGRIARVPVQDLVRGSRDVVTRDIATAAAAGPDNWYHYAFNSVTPIAKGLMADNNFGPLRAGFARIGALEIVDAFGQRMTLQTPTLHPDHTQDTITAFPVTPAPGDTAHQGSIYLPPRLLAPSRLWFRWLSSRHDDKVAAITGDFVEANSHPATSPVCGIVVPNHLDDTLAVYQPEGQAIGAFGVEHGTLVYRTRAGNTANPSDSLAADIGAKGATPLVNPHLYDVMWRINDGGAGFLTDMMTAIRNSEGFLNPQNYAQNTNLAVLFGQPLVLTRAVLGIETLGYTLPVSQADTTSQPAFHQDVTAGRYRYPDRQANGAAALQSVRIPVQLGNLADIDDGMIGFFLDQPQTPATPYGTFFAPAAPQAGGHGVQRPDAQTLEVMLNATPVAITFLMDPRAAVHATTGLLPVESIAVPPDQYGAATERLQISFDTHPVLAGAGGLVLPLPQEQGYAWGWVPPGPGQGVQPLAANAGTEVPTFGFSPQTLLEGWTVLQKPPPPPQGSALAPKVRP